MPFSFVQIEKDKTAAIQWSLAFLVLFYCLGALLIVGVVKMMMFSRAATGMYFDEPVPFWGGILDITTTLWTLGGALLLSAIHWQMSVNGLIDGVLRLMGGRPVDLSKDDERIFKNVVEEAAVAIGGQQTIEPCIIPTSAMNAFALQDFNKRALIGITEGLLKRLNREQLEAVIAHEAGHIASGDCLSTTVTTALFKAFDNVCDFSRVMMQGAFYAGSGSGRRRDSGGGQVAMIALVVFLLASLLRVLGFLGAMFISRQREYRADAVSMRLTRNPMALAEALYIINSKWKGGGIPGEGMDAIFILSPRKKYIEDNEDFLSDLFSTHPPVNKRIGILLETAHAGAQDLENALKKAQQRFEAIHPEEPRPAAASTAVADRWFIRQHEAWQGPFGVEQVTAMAGLQPDTPVRREGAPVITEARFDQTLRHMIREEKLQKDMCPRCRVPLTQAVYEGCDVLTCGSCQGALVSEMDVLSILAKRDMQFSARIAGLADIVRQQAAPLKRMPYDAIYDEKSILCPHCLTSSPRMTRRFVNPQYPVEVDKCRICARVWFDKDELEILQYLYEKDHPVA